MKKISFLSLVMAITLSFSSSTAFAFKGTFEAPFIETETGDQVEGSEGKISESREYKVEIEGLDSQTVYTLCLFAANLPAPLLLASQSPDEDGEFKIEEYIDGVDYLQGPSFQIYEGLSCTDPVSLVYETGLEFEGDGGDDGEGEDDF